MSFRKRITSLISLRQQTRSRNRNSAITRRLLVESMEARRLLTTIDLATLTASEGMTLYGATGGELSGFSVSDAGDVNGDGLDDLIVSSKEQSRFGFFVAGASYLVYGSTTMPASIDLGTIGTAGVTFQGVKGTGRFGYSVSAAGDVNADGFDDLIMSAPFGLGPMNEANAGDTYVFFGSASLPSVISANSANVTIFGAEAQDRSGISVSGAGDVNGDGYDDMVIGAHLADAAGNAKSGAGESYVIYGGASMPATIDLATLGTAGVTIYGSGAGDQLGLSVSGAGDVNGDGFADVILGAGYADTTSPVRSTGGESYVIFGGTALPATIDLAVPASTFITILGVQGGDFAGYTVGGGGDVNGDGFDELLINAPGGDGPGANTRTTAGDSYVVFGSASLPPTIDLLTLGTAGITIFGADAGDAGIDVNTGGFISTAGDVNADGYDDLIIGKERADAASNAKSGAGDSIVVFGGPSLPTTIDLFTLGSAGITIFGAGAADNNGVSVSSAGDVNGDGFADLLTGAFLADGVNNLRSSSGESYLIYGSNTFTSSVTHPGTSSAETLTGTAAANVMVGGRGNDILLGNGGADVFNGGEGNDTIAVSILPFKRASGGNGDDTLRLDGSGLTLDLTTLADNRLQGIELIDITGSGINTLTLNYREVLNISDESNQLIVRRNGGDVVNIGSGWTQGADQLIGSDNFQTYTQGIATLLIEDTTPVGSSGDDAFVLTYLGSNNTGSLNITLATNGGPIIDVGTYPMNVPLVIDGLGGTDSVRINGTSGGDSFIVNSAGITINGASLTLSNFESRTLAANAGNDLYQFDTTSPLGLYSIIESGVGIDTINLASSTLPVTLNLGLAATQVVNTNLSLILSSASTIENATGGSADDVLTGNSLANTLVGGNGNDTLAGGRGSDTMSGGAGNDTYVFDLPSSSELDTLNESANQGTDLLNFAALALPVTLNLGLTSNQLVHTSRRIRLNSATAFENVTSGSGNDTLIGNNAANVLTSGSGNDTLTGGRGNDRLFGGIGDDTYIFGQAPSAEADQVTELSGQGTDRLSFSDVTTAVTLSLASTSVQTVHTNRTLKLNSASVIEDAAGGTADDILTGNNLNNLLRGGAGDDILVGSAGADQLFGEAGRDILIGGNGLDTLDGGTEEDILIAGRTTSDTVNSNLNALRTEWKSANSYSTRITNLRTGVGPSNSSLKATVNVLNDAGEDDVLTGGTETDWHFAAVDDVINDLFVGEVLERLNVPVSLLQTSQTGAQIAANPAITFFETGTVNGTSLDFTSGAAGDDKYLFEWNLLPAGARGELEIAVTIDHTALTVDNDFIFGLTDGVNFNAWERSDNSGGSWWKREDAVSGTSVAGFTFVKGSLATVEPFTIRFRIPAGGALTQLMINEGTDSITDGFATNPLNGNNALKFFMARQGASEDYRVNSVQISVVEYV